MGHIKRACWPGPVSSGTPSSLGVRPHLTLTATIEATGIVPPNRGRNGFTENLSLLHSEVDYLSLPRDADNMCDWAELVWRLRAGPWLQVQIPTLAAH